jgi:hypothetical protein
MAQNNNILQELNELNSSLGDITVQNPYTVPVGYFDGLVEQMLNRIRAMEAKNATDEVVLLSPFLNTVSRQMPFVVPADYFEGLAEQVLQSVRESSNYQTAKEEIENLSPLLSGLKKEVPYSVPDGYFERLDTAPVKSEVEVVSITHRRWFKYAAAAVITGIVALSGIILFTGIKKGADDKILAQVKKDVMKMDETQKDNFIDFIDAGMNGKETAGITTDDKSKEIKALLQDVSDEELKNFQEQTEDLQNVLMTN